jgi:hypothetical protein
VQQVESVRGRDGLARETGAGDEQREDAGNK